MAIWRPRGVCQGKGFSNSLVAEALHICIHSANEKLADDMARHVRTTLARRLIRRSLIEIASEEDAELSVGG